VWTFRLLIVVVFTVSSLSNWTMPLIPLILLVWVMAEIFRTAKN
jgi:hypothetical protein